MSRTDPGPDHQKHAQIILSESRRLLELINQVLDISKIEAGKMELHPSVFDINELLDELQRAFALQAGQKGLKFIIEKGDDLPRAVIGDLLKVRQVLVNLLGNAFKFTERGQVTLSILRIHNAQADSPVLIRFQVSDTGPGIQPDRIGKIFQRFEQVDYSLSRKAGGTGLGTSISKQLVTLMGGTVGVESVYGSGSTFWAEIPFEETAQIPDNTVEALLPAVSLHGKHILLVEDYEPNQQVAQLHLNAADVTLTIASNGLDAVSFAQEKKFDCILMDVQMPVMDGLEATASIRGLPGPNAAIPIIGMTAFVYDTDRAKCFAAGMSEVLPKPVEWDIALVKISAWIQNRSMWPRESPAPAALAAPVAQNEKMPLHKQPSGTAVLDWERYVTRMRGNADMALTIVNGFMEQLPTTLAELSDAQTAKDRETVIRLVHSVKGAALNICADSLAATAKDLEIYLREHESGGEEELMKEFLKKCGELQTWVLDFTQKEIKK
jgi:two-component system sensor histidine kinase/response regulator